MEWQHWVDSRDSSGRNTAKDVGRCHPQPNGDTLELGSMINPETGTETEYEELWGTATIESTDPRGPKAKHVVVLQMVEKPPDNGTDSPSKGMAIRVGQFIQGIVVHNGLVTVERWTYDKGWLRVVRLGSAELPCSLLFDPSTLVEGEPISSGRFSWKVLETTSWGD
jgi:hypothetical protein